MYSLKRLQIQNPRLVKPSDEFISFYEKKDSVFVKLSRSQIKSCATSANVTYGWNLRVSNRIACFIIQRSFRSRLRKLMKLSFKAHNAKILNILVLVSSAPFSAKKNKKYKLRSRVKIENAANLTLSLPKSCIVSHQVKMEMSLQFIGYLRTSSSKLQKARNKIEVFLALPCWQLN